MARGSGNDIARHIIGGRAKPSCYNHKAGACDLRSKYRSDSAIVREYLKLRYMNAKMGKLTAYHRAILVLDDSPCKLCSYHYETSVHSFSPSLP